MTTYTLRKGSPARTRTDLVVVGVTRNAKGELEAAAGGTEVAEAYGRKFRPLLKSMGFHGEAGAVLRVPTLDTVRASQLLLVGMGDGNDLDADSVRRAAGVAARNTGNAASVALALPTPDADHVGAIVEGFASGSYRFAGVKHDPDKEQEDSGPADVSVLTDLARKPEAVRAAERAELLTELVGAARDWVNTPPNNLSPAAFADAVVGLRKRRGGRKTGVDVEVFDVAKLEELGCGGVLGVGQGSTNEPRLVKLTWRPAEAKAHVAFVGKGITYDSGGLTIKPGSSMATMKYDMGGAAAVIAATFAIAALEVPVAVTTFAPMAENMPSGSAMRPGDVLTIRNGKTVEITNTDAEGRLVLADGLSLAVEEEPDVIVDAATLTGACIVALGEKYAGLFGDDATTSAIARAAAGTGELLWRLPIPEEIQESVRTGSKIADVLQHNWVRWGSSLFAAAFLEEFTGGLPWAHLDIAGPAWNTGGPSGHLPAGATGFGVPTLVAYAEQLAGD